MTPEKRRVLVVTDSQITKNTLDDLLRDIYEVDYPKVVRETFGYLKASLLVPARYSAMIINIENDCCDAIELLRQIRRDNTYKYLPIMILSSNPNDAEEVEALECGANEYMECPFNSLILLKRLKNLVTIQDAFLRIRSLEMDSKTRLLTKQAFYERLPKKLRELYGKEYSLVVFSIERFHTINESYGYEEGDKFIISLAGLVNDFILQYGGMCARTDGTRFTVLIPHEENVFDMYFDVLNEYIVSYQNRAKVYLKFGVYHITDIRENPFVISYKAEIALKKAVESFDKNIIEYDDNVDKKVEFENTIADDLSKALKNGEIKVYYQPKHYPHDGGLSGAEALTRWEHPTFGFMNPGQFIPILERNGLITELDLFVLEHVCMRTREWMDRYQRYAHISVNLSRKDFYRDDIVDVLCQITDKYDLDPKMIHIEVTESAYVEAPEKLLEVLKEIKNKGFVFELDDFGTGFSSLSLLADMPADIIKLDRAFV
ncbi:MAG: EAL domain-containing protein, partial [Lachnospiraceae bacterium]|nr:EAL domain-containing protein [Lachnospiraceae bacterium]